MHLSDYCYDSWVVKCRLAREMRLLDNAMPDRDGAVVLDAGTGADGLFLAEYARRGLKPIRMDIDIGYLRAARRAEGGGAHLVAGDVNRIPLASESVDFVFLCEVLEHLNSPEQALDEARRVLKRGGCIIIDVPWLHQAYRPLSAIALRCLRSFRRTGRPPLLLRLLFKNLDRIEGMGDHTALRRSVAGRMILSTVRLLPTFRSFAPEHFVYDYFHGTVPEGNMHLQFRAPPEWGDAISRAGFAVEAQTGAFLTPPLLGRFRLCNWLSGAVEKRLGNRTPKWPARILVIAGVRV